MYYNRNIKIERGDCTQSEYVSSHYWFFLIDIGCGPYTSALWVSPLVIGRGITPWVSSEGTETVYFQSLESGYRPLAEVQGRVTTLEKKTNYLGWDVKSERSQGHGIIRTSSLFLNLNRLDSSFLWRCNR